MCVEERKERERGGGREGGRESTSQVYMWRIHVNHGVDMVLILIPSTALISAHVCVPCAQN